MLYMPGHPSGAMKEVTGNCDSRLIPISISISIAFARCIRHSAIWLPKSWCAHPFRHHFTQVHCVTTAKAGCAPTEGSPQRGYSVFKPPTRGDWSAPEGNLARREVTLAREVALDAADFIKLKSVS
jgi:hypothetical protein